MTAAGRACPNCGEVAVTLHEYMKRGGARFTCRACGEPLRRSLWIVPVQIAWSVVFFVGLLAVVSLELESGVAVFLGVVLTAVIAMAGARYVTWRFVPFTRAPEGRDPKHAVGEATVPAFICGAWATAWSHTEPLLVGTIVFGLIWVVAFLASLSSKR
jgi:hypothetical protein